jgi:hypothetical protein
MSLPSSTVVLVDEEPSIDGLDTQRTKSFSILEVEGYPQLPMERYVDRSQTTFIEGSCLYEGVFARHEISHESCVKKLKCLLLKVDAEKT